MAAPRQLRGSRRDIALAVSGGAKTLYECAKALGRPSGSIYRVVQRMVADEILIPDSTPPTRGTLYHLSGDAREALELALAQEQPPGHLREGQRVLLVTGDSGVVRLHEVLSDLALSGCIGWASELDGGGMLMAMGPDVASLQVQRLVIALELAGYRCEQRRLGELIDPGALRRRAGALLETVPNRARARA